MHQLAALAAAGLLSAAPIPGATGDAQLEATSFAYDVASGTWRLEGSVVITRGAVRLRAHTARWDPRTSTVEAAGGVLLTDATRAVAAEGLHAVLGGDFEATEVVAFLKDGPTALAGATTQAEAAACGRNALTAIATHAVGSKDGRMQLTRARITPCDCRTDGPPSWELRSSHAVVRPGDRVELSWPVLWITPRFLFIDRPVPVFAFPWISLPLTRRASGLLAPQVRLTGTEGFLVEQPWFLTLGQSADLTLTPRYAFGPLQPVPSNGVVRGPGLSLELRWAPAEGSAGRIQADTLWDLADEANPAQGVAGGKGLRLELRGEHAQRFDERTSLWSELDVVGDPLYVRDFTTDYFLRLSTARRSGALLERRGQDGVLELTAAWLQPISASGALAGIPGGLFGSRLPAFQRWPSLSAMLLPLDLTGPLRLSGRAGLARYAPPRGVTSDDGLSGVGPIDTAYVPGLLNPGQGDGRWQPGERLAASRLDARAELSAPFTVGEVVSVVPFLRGAALGYLFDADHGPLANAWGLAGLEVSTELMRRYGNLRHTLEPRLEWRYGSANQGPALPAFSYDAWDRGEAVPPGADPSFSAPRLTAVAPPGVYHQARLALATRLSDEKAEFLRAEVGQEFDLRRGRLSEGYVTGLLTRGLVTFDADARFWTSRRPQQGPAELASSWLDGLSQLRLGLHIADGRGDALHFGLVSLGPGGSGQLGAGSDVLFDPRVADIGGYVVGQPWSIASGSLGGQIHLGGATLGYTAQVPAREAVVGACQGSGAALRTVSSWHVLQHVGTMEWDSPCHCFRVKAMARYDDCGGYGGGFSIDLGQLVAVPSR